MKLIDKFLVRIPLSEISIKTTINSYAVIERIEHTMKPTYMRPQRNQYFTFEGSYEGNYFVIQAHLKNPDGGDAFPNYGSIGVWSFQIPFRYEISPCFYGRVFDVDGGSVLKGHFGFPLPFVLAPLIIVALFLVNAFHLESAFLTIFIIAAFPLMIFGYIQFVIEREGLTDFLAGLFFNAIRKD
jgi:hypothetical protein